MLRGLAAFVARWFALLIVLGALLGLTAPQATGWFAPYIPLALGVVMFCMGLTLRATDFAIVLKHPQAVLIGVLAQFIIMPLLGFGIGHLLQLAPLLLVGMILVGAAPGGTASNIIVYFARGDVALSVAMTSISTLLAPLMTPLLVLWLAGSTLEVNAGALMVSVLKVVLVPVIAGLLVRGLAPSLVERLLHLLPVLSVSGIVVVVAAVVGVNADAVWGAGLLLALAVVLHNVCGLAIGYVVARLLQLPESVRRTIGIEVGMQNSGLAAALATMHFAPLAALPAALFSVWHNLSGAMLASFWVRRPPEPMPATTDARPGLSN